MLLAVPAKVTSCRGFSVLRMLCYGERRLLLGEFRFLIF